MGTKALLEQEVDLQVTVAETAHHALELYRREPFDVLLVDLVMPEINGLEFTSMVMKYDPHAKVIIYTGMDIEPHIDSLIEIGVSGFLSKTAPIEEILLAIRCCLSGNVMIPITLFQQLRKKGADLSSRNTEQEMIIENVSFTERELQILIEVAKGLKNREIAKTMFISQRTVEHDLTQIFSKLKVRSRTEAVSKAQQLGLIPVEQLRLATR